MKILFRADASNQIGSGHIMRCLTLALALVRHGYSVEFICRQLTGNLINIIESYNIKVNRLKVSEAVGTEKSNSWLGATHEQEIDQVSQLIATIKPALIIVDHYLLDQNWSTAININHCKMMVIDDLANRYHDCDLLLDQNFHHDFSNRYSDLISGSCHQLLGPKYALLREEFNAAKANQIDYRDRLSNKLITVFFGGGDPSNETLKALRALVAINPVGYQIDVILGQANCHKKALQQLADQHAMLEIHVQVNDMAQRLANSSLFVGAVGSITWERCCCATPAIVATIADNQLEAAITMAEQGYHTYVGHHDITTEQDYYDALNRMINHPELLAAQSEKSAQLVDGLGCQRVVKEIVDRLLS